QCPKLITTESRKHVAASQLIVDQPCNLPNQTIPGRMPAGVIDHLELIEIQIEQGVLGAMLAMVLDCQCYPCFEFAAIAQPGQWIMSRLVLQPRCQSAFVSDVA